MTEKEVQSLEDFHNLVDQIIEDLESGKISSNPLAVEKKIEEIDAEDLVQRGNSVEMGEDELMDYEAIADIQQESAENIETGAITINGTSFNFTEEGEFYGRPGKVLVVVSNEMGEVVFGSAAVAARETGFNPTTMRSRCAQEYVDENNNTWKYRDRND